MIKSTVGAVLFVIVQFTLGSAQAAEQPPTAPQAPGSVTVDGIEFSADVAPPAISLKDGTMSITVAITNHTTQACRFDMQALWLQVTDAAGLAARNGLSIDMPAAFDNNTVVAVVPGDTVSLGMSGRVFRSHPGSDVVEMVIPQPKIHLKRNIPLFGFHGLQHGRCHLVVVYNSSIAPQVTETEDALKRTLKEPMWRGVAILPSREFTMHVPSRDDITGVKSSAVKGEHTQ